jgi:glyoxylase I family protein
MKFLLEHIGLAARNTVTLKDWYVAMLDAQVVFDNGQSPPAFFISLPGGVFIEIYKGDFSLKEVSDNALQGWRHLALQVESIEAARDGLSAKGIEFREPIKPAGGGGRVLFFQDGEGNLLHLVERAPESPIKSGRGGSS